MGLAEYKAQHKPKGHRKSILEAWWTDIVDLRSDGYTNDQIVHYLATEGVNISITGLSKYIQRRLDKKAKITERENSTQADKHAEKMSNNPTQSRESNNPFMKVEGAKSAASFNPIAPPVEISKD
jgi:hypothetical protein